MLWTAQFASDIGTWAQTVGAQWFLVSASGSATLIALVQTATSLPVVLLAVPAGVVADLLDRRRMLIWMQSLLFVVAAVLCVAALSGHLTPIGLLSATFALGIGVAASTPAWQSVQPDVVSIELLPTATTLSSASINIGRSAGPAIGGLLVSLVGPGWTFGLNAVSYLAVVAALVRWRTSRPPDGDRERFGAAIRTGMNHMRHSSAMRRIVARAALWTFPGSVIWALLPVLAHRQLGLGSIGYGLVLASLGVGAVLGALILAPLRPRIPINRLLAGSGLVFAAAIVAISRIRIVWLALLLMMVAGMCWIATLSTVNSSAQVLLPRWVRARGIGFVWVALQGGTALGAALWGSLAEHSSVPIAFLAAAGVTLLATATLGRLGLPEQVPPLAGHPIAWLVPAWPTPHSQLEGPVTVDIEYVLAVDRAADFAATLPAVRRGRLRTGGHTWHAAPDPADSAVIHERYELATVRDAELQNSVRLQAEDVAAYERLAGCCTRTPVMTCAVRGD